MSEHELRAWLSLVGSALVWGFVGLSLLGAYGWTLVAVPGRAVLGAYIELVVLVSVVQAGIALAPMAWRRSKPLADERDTAIQAAGSRVEGIVTLVLVNVLILQLLAQAVHLGQPLARLDFTSIPTLIAVLVSILFAAHIGRQIAIVWCYRA